VQVTSAIERTIGMIIDAANGGRRPRGARQAFVYTYVGEDYPADPGLWAFQGAATKRKFTVVLPNTVPSGARVWVCAAWVSTRGQAGPPSVPVSTNIPGGGTIAPGAAAGVRIAA